MASSGDYNASRLRPRRRRHPASQVPVLYAAETCPLAFYFDLLIYQELALRPPFMFLHVYYKDNCQTHQDLIGLCINLY